MILEHKARRNKPWTLRGVVKKKYLGFSVTEGHSCLGLLGHSTGIPLLVIRSHNCRQEGLDHSRMNLWPPQGYDPTGCIGDLTQPPEVALGLRLSVLGVTGNMVTLQDPQDCPACIITRVSQIRSRGMMVCGTLFSPQICLKVAAMPSACPFPATTHWRAGGLPPARPTLWTETAPPRYRAPDSPATTVLPFSPHLVWKNQVLA